MHDIHSADHLDTHSAVDPAPHTGSHPVARPRVASGHDVDRPGACSGSDPARHSLAALLCTLCVVCLLYTFVPDDTPVQNIILTGLLAIVTLGAITFSAPATLKHVGVGAYRKVAIWTVFVGLIGGVGSLTVVNSWSDLTLSSGLTQLILVLILCLMTGVFEEGFFRVLFMNALVEHGPFSRRPWFAAAVLSSAVFALLHVSLAALVGISGVSSNENFVLMQAFLKLAQTFTFGMIMAGLYTANGNLWPNALLHALFNLFYLGPIYLGWAVPTTYLPGSSDDFTVLIITLVLLIPPAVTLWRKLLQSQR